MLWIMSQDRNELINLISASIVDCTILGIDTTCRGSNCYVLGTYATESRAKEVLAEIFDLFQCTGIKTDIRTYEMPLE